MEALPLEPLVLQGERAAWPPPMEALRLGVLVAQEAWWLLALLLLGGVAAGRGRGQAPAALLLLPGLLEVQPQALAALPAWRAQERHGWQRVSGTQVVGWPGPGPQGRQGVGLRP